MSIIEYILSPYLIFLLTTTVISIILFDRNDSIFSYKLKKIMLISLVIIVILIAILSYMQTNHITFTYMFDYIGALFNLNKDYILDRLISVISNVIILIAALIIPITYSNKSKDHEIEFPIFLLSSFIIFAVIIINIFSNNLSITVNNDNSNPIIPIESYDSTFIRINPNNYEGYFITKEQNMKCYYKFEIVSIDMLGYGNNN